MGWGRGRGGEERRVGAGTRDLSDKFFERPPSLAASSSSSGVFERAGTTSGDTRGSGLGGYPRESIASYGSVAHTRVCGKRERERERESPVQNPSVQQLCRTRRKPQCHSAVDIRRPVLGASVNGLTGGRVMGDER